MENTVEGSVNVNDIKKPLIKKIKWVFMWAIMAIILQVIFSNIVQGVLAFGLNFVIAAQIGSSRVQHTAEELQALVQSEAANYLMTIVGIGYIVANTVATIICVNTTKIGKIKDWFKKPQFTAVDTILGCFSITGIAYLVVTVLSLFSAILGNTAENINSAFGSGLFSGKPIAVIGTIAYMALIGPICEELLCRGAILQISSAVSRRFALVASAVLFGLMHANIIQIVNATIMGLILGYVAEKSRSLITTCIMHIFNNSMAVVASFITEKFLPGDAGNVFMTVVMFTFMALGVVSVILLYRKYGKPTEEDGIPGNEIVSKKDIALVNAKPGELTAKIFFTRPAFFVVLAYAVALSVFAAIA